MGNEDTRNRSLVKEWCQTDLVTAIAPSLLLSPAHVDTLCHTLAPNRAAPLPVNCVANVFNASFFLSFWQPTGNVSTAHCSPSGMPRSSLKCEFKLNNMCIAPSLVKCPVLFLYAFLSASYICGIISWWLMVLSLCRSAFICVQRPVGPHGGPDSPGRLSGCPLYLSAAAG